MKTFDAFTRAYITAALWSTLDDGTPRNAPLDENYCMEDIHTDTLARMAKDCARFKEQHGETLARAGQGDESDGHNFWLTRNRHGAGFWDGDYGEEGDTLTDAAHAFGEFDLYIGDDGQIHGG